MPEVTINLAAGRTPDQKKQLMKEITDVVCRTCNVDPANVVVSIQETPLAHKMKGGVLFSER